MKIKKNILILILTGILLCCVVAGCVFFKPVLPSSRNQVKNTENTVSVTPDETVKEPEVSSEPLNIVLFGLSADYMGIDDNRCDTIMVCTIDDLAKEVRLTSILRDTKADIQGYEAQKINASYKYGGATLALDTINQNFDTDFSSYITINIDNFAKVADALGGVSIELTEDEASVINTEVNGSELVAGMQHLNGEQAIAYARIRSIDSDIQRTDRQRKMLSALYQSFVEASTLFKLTSGLEFMSNVETSLSYMDVLALIDKPLSEYTVITNYIPDNTFETDVYSTIDEHGEWVWIYDTHHAGIRLRELTGKINEKNTQNKVAYVER